MRKLFTTVLTLCVFYSAFGLAEKSDEGTASLKDLKKVSVSKGDVFFSTQTADIDLSFVGPLPPPCPLTVEPVCGNNGVTYLNPCFALSAGISQYSSGVCFSSSCINPAAINLSLVCPQVYNPVCGCNGQTYSNPCEAQKNGVVSYTPGPCNTGCYNPALILNGGGVTLNSNTGVLALACPQSNAPVCGCNGVTYSSPCVAQANGISFYAYGTCQSGCINPAQMNPNANCPGTFTPVCGCNGVTYPNSCQASAAGVTSFTPGACGGLSAWCNKAVPIQCGDYLPYETTVGAGNSLNSYPGCSNDAFLGPDKVYMINKTTPGDLQIGIEIMTPGLDLDIFLLSGNCSQVTCLRSSTTNNSLTNNEGILLVNAPIGIYYLVVDGQFPNSQGQYRLEVSCGYLNCSNAIALNCGVPFNHTNLNGHDDVSLYGCDGNIYNVENNGPEVVHTFTVTASGWVNISLTNLQDNLELFLLRSCDRGGCVDFSENGGTTNEQITAFLQPGTYYVVVDGYNGAVSPYTLLVDCASSCAMTFANIAPVPAACGQANGSIGLVTSGGSPGYVVQYTGPLNGNFSSSSSTNNITGLPAGLYQVRVTDTNGCSITQSVTVPSNSNMSAGVSLTTSICGVGGSAQFTIMNGVQPFSIQLFGPVSGTYNAGSSNPYTISNLSHGNYTAYIRDALGCVVVRTFTISYSSGNFSFTATPAAAGCTAPGSVFINTTGGAAPYTISLNGPVSGTLTSNNHQFNIINLPGGTYTIAIQSAGNCLYTRTVVVPNTGLQMSATAQNGACSQPGSIALQFSGGVPPYSISWGGPSPGSTTTSSSTYLITGLSSGNYAIQVQDAAGCRAYDVRTINNTGGALSATFSVIGGGCAPTGSITVQVNNGTPQYSISWSGPVSGNTTTASANYTIPNLPGGSYVVQVTDAAGCSRTGIVTITAGVALNVSLTSNNTGCGQNGSVNVSMSGGAAPYSISWSGPVSGSATSQSANYTIPNLPSGIYTVVVSSGGCQTSGVLAVANGNPGQFSIQLIPLHPLCGQGGSIWLDIFGGSGPYNVIWTGPTFGNITIIQSGIDIFALPGTYTVLVTNSAGCSATQTITILETTFQVTAVGQSQNCVSTTGNILVSMANGQPNYNISWLGPVNGFTTTSSNNFLIPNLPIGVYTIIVTDAGGCVMTLTVHLSGQIDLFVDATPAVCGQSGRLKLDIIGGAAPYTVTWSGGASGSAITSNNNFAIQNLPAGNYTVVVTDANGCAQTRQATITSTGDIDLVLTPAPGQCNQNGAIWLDILGGTAPYQLMWTGPVSGSITLNVNGYNIQNLPSGTYSVKVTDANGCMVTKITTLSNAGGNPIVSLTPSNGFCGQPGSIGVHITGATGPFTIVWSGPVSGSISTPNSAYVINNLPGGTYTVTVIGSNGCSGSATVSINNSGSGIVITGSAENGDCGMGGAIWLDIMGGSPYFTITWTGPVSGSTTFSNFGYLITNLPNGTYTVRVTDFYGCTSNTLTITVYSGTMPNFTATPNPGICGQPGTISLSISGSPAPYMVTWTGPVSGMVSNVQANYTLTNLPGGTYTITVKDAHNCTKTQVITLPVSNNLQITAVPVPGVCGQPGAIHIGMSGGTSPFTIVWSGPVNGSATTSNFFYNINNLPSGAYTITVTDASGCTRTQTVVLNNGANNVSLNITPIPGLCGSTGSLWVDILGGTAPYQLMWTGPVSGSITLQVNGYNIPNLPAGAYTVKVTDAQGCMFTRIVTLTNSGGSVVITGSAENGDCGMGGAIWLDITGGSPFFTITWTGPVSGSTTFSNFGYLITNLPNGTYTVRVTDFYGCISNTLTITVFSGTMPNFTATPHPGLCGQPGTISLNISGSPAPYMVTWTGPVSGMVNNVQANYTLTNLPGGTYTITVKDANNCTKTQTVTLNNSGNNLQITVVGIPGVCGQPGQIHVGMTGGTAPFTVSWSGPVNGFATTNNFFYNIVNLPSGVYNVTVTDAFGCTRTQTVVLNNGASNVNLVITPIPGVCSTNGSLWVDIVGGVAPWQLMWTGPVSGSVTLQVNGYSIPNLPSGTYSVKVTDGQGCMYTIAVTLNNGANNLQVTAVPVPGVCAQPGQIHVGMTGGAAPFTVSWTGPQNGMATTSNFFYNILNLASGTYTVTVTDAQGCSRTQTVVLNNGANNLQITAVAVPGVCAQPGQIHVGMTGGVAPFTVSWTGPQNGMATTSNFFYNILNLTSGTYTVTVTDAQGCSSTRTVVLNNGANNLQITAVTVPGVCGQPGQIHVGMTGGTAPFTVSWTGPQNGMATTSNFFYNILNLTSGTYTVTVTDAQGCSSTRTVVLNNGANNLQITAVPVPGVCAQPGQIHVGMTGGTAPFTVSWTGPQNGMATTSNFFYNILNLASGTYTVTVTDAQGCSSTRTVVLNNGANNLQITAVAVPGVCGQTGQIHVGMTGGTAPFTVSWTGPQNGMATTGNAFYNILNLPGGTYTVTVTDAQGCSRTQTVVLNNGANNLQITAVAVPGVCGQTGQIHVGMTGGTAPFTVSWTGPQNGMATTGNAFYNILNLASGTYTVTVTDAQGCSRSQTVILNNGAGITLAATGTNGICGQPGSIQLTFSGGTTPYSITWTGPVSGNATANTGNYTISNLPSGTYTVTAGNGPNCLASQTVTLNNALAFNMTVTSNPGICNINGSLALFFTGGAPAISITWSGPVSGSASTNSNSYTLSNLPTGSYTITATSAQNCTDTEVIILNNATNMLTVTATPVNGLCGEPGSVTLLLGGGTGPYNIVWGGISSGSTTAAGSSITIPNLGAGTYTFAVTDANNCAQATTASVAVAENDISITATSNTGNCGQEGSIQLIISGGNPGYVINWSGPESGSITTSNSIYVINGVAAGTYQITVTDASGCTETGVSALNLPENDLDIGVIATNGLCGQSGSVTVNIFSGTAPYSIVWSGAANGSTTTSNSSFTIANAPVGAYVVVVTDANGCTHSGTATVGAQPGVNVNAIAMNGVCGQQGSVIVNLVGGTGPYTIVWTGAANGTTTIANTTYTIPNLGNGTYNVAVTDANGCTSTSTALLNNSGSTFSINAFTYNGFCGELGYIRVNMFGGVAPFLITWTGPSSGSATTMASSYDILHLTSGLYMISVTDAQGCNGLDVEMVNNSSLNLLSVSVSAINGTCGDLGSIWISVLHGQGPYVITWTGPQSGTITTSSTEFDIPNLPGGTYTVTIRDYNLCVKTFTIVVANAPDNLNVSLTANNNTCGNPGSITVNMAGNAPPYLITWNSLYGSGNQTVNTSTFTIPNLQTGNYSVRVEDATGCFETHFRQVNNEAGNFVMNIVPNVGGCSFQTSLQINISGGQAPYLLNWTGLNSSGSVSFSSSSYNLFGLTPGIYTVLVTDALGCTKWQTVVLNQGNSVPVAAFSSSVNLLTASFTNNSSPGSYVWNFGDGTSSTAANPIHTYAQDGIYIVCLLVSNACGTTTHCANVTISIPSSTVILDIGENSGSAGGNIVIPITIRNCSLLVSLAGTFAVQNPAVANITGIIPAAIAPQFNAGNKTFNYYANNGQGIPLQQNQILFYIVVQLTGSPGQSTLISFVNTPLAVEVGSMVNGNPVALPHITLTGSASIITALQIAGEIQTYWGTPMPDVEVRLNGDHMQMMEMTDNNGHYFAPDLPMGEMVTVTPSKNTSPANGLSTYGLFIGQRFILGLEPPQIASPYQIIAGDANCNGAFTTLDLFIIQQLIIGVRDSFAHCPAWVFVADSYDLPESDFDAYNVFPYPSFDSMMVMDNVLADFTGVKVGDILGHANPDNFTGDPSLEPRYTTELELTAPNRTAPQGQIISIPVRSSNFNDITNYQLGLWFDTQYLTFNGFDAPASGALASVVAGASQAAAGRINISWFNLAGSGVNAGADEVLFTLHFTANAHVPNLADVMEVRSQWIQSEAYNSTEERMGVVLHFEQQGVTSTDEPSATKEGYHLYQNAPNPFMGNTVIAFDLPEAMDAELVITDQLGRTVRIVRGTYPKGRNTVELEAGNLTQGVYRYTLKTAEFSATRSMILMK